MINSFTLGYATSQKQEKPFIQKEIAIWESETFCLASKRNIYPMLLRLKRSLASITSSEVSQCLAFVPRCLWQRLKLPLTIYLSCSQLNYKDFAFRIAPRHSWKHIVAHRKFALGTSRSKVSLARILFREYLDIYKQLDQYNWPHQNG